MTMTHEESDRILNETTRIGRLEVIIEDVGTAQVHMPFEAPLRMFISQVECVVLKKVVISYSSGIPWLLVNYDKDSGKLIVRKK